MPDLLLSQVIGDCFYIFISADPETDMRRAVQASLLMEDAVKQMLHGKITPDELLEMVEPIVDDVDSFVEEVEENLAEIHLM